MRWPRYTLRQLLIAVAVVAVGLAWWQGTYRSQKVHHTGRELDLAISGHGFFVIKDWPQGQIFYTRHGNFSINSNGQIGDGAIWDGKALEPQITVPHDWTKIRVSDHGVVDVLQSVNGVGSQIGQMLIARFMNPEGLEEVLPGLFVETRDSGVPMTGPPGQSGLGFIQQGWLEDVPGKWTSRPGTSDVLLWAALALLIWVSVRIAMLERKLNQMQTLLAQNLVASAIDACAKPHAEWMPVSQDTLRTPNPQL